ncbi:hypothetical protein LO762_14785 [Actinocorallia sp. API 0066]|uniref:hypothetical protein n=1 Tax=Actinocorallia sp. API 0066 TaxID=2896846 RepID=UPI001E598C28|nr:hypothetical protein [Actinocorallia sp. API 0066]MCD0450446.1 hypothetical protein [Actinocorallia sp. API 0066]
MDNTNPAVIVSDCKGDDCPKVFAPQDGMVPIQGYVRPDITTPDGEAAIQIPVSMILEAARVLGG